MIHSFGDFSPDKELQKKYDNLIISRSEYKLVCIFMSKDFQESHLSVIVYNKSTLCSPLTFSAFKNGIRVPLGKILNPNNGLNCYSQFFEAVHVAYNYNLQVDDVVNKVVLILQTQNSELDDTKKAKKLKFITRQLQLLTHKTFSVADYCFAIESFPNCNYEQLRDFLVLPSKRKLQSILSKKRPVSKRAKRDDSSKKDKNPKKDFLEEPTEAIFDDDDDDDDDDDIEVKDEPLDEFEDPLQQKLDLKDEEPEVIFYEDDDDDDDDIEVKDEPVDEFEDPLQ